jgi:hypothetical protein
LQAYGEIKKIYFPEKDEEKRARFTTCKQSNDNIDAGRIRRKLRTGFLKPCQPTCVLNGNTQSTCQTNPRGSACPKIALSGSPRY